jgi:AAA+ ATPase superfamily predicted ATPase
VALPRPADVYNRVVEWDDLAAFVTDGADGPPGPRPPPQGAGLQVAVVYWRRRRGKSFLLRRLAAVTGGFYYQALEDEPSPALEHLGAALGAWLGVPGRKLAFSDWIGAVDALTQLGRDSAGPVVAIIDEFPYLLDRVPELSSLLQRAVDDSRYASNSPVRLVLCGSALSIMAELFSGQRALRGRVATTLKVEPFDFREAASYWRVGGNWPLAV